MTTHEDFIDEYLDKVEGDAEQKPEPVRFNHFQAQREKRVAFPVEVKPARPVIERVEEEFSMLCRGCGVDTDEIDEYYMVQFDIWQTFVPKEHLRQVLCIGCLEGYLGRQLISEDFIEAPVNYTRDKSERLLNRMGQWFREFDGPYETDEERVKSWNELGRRLDGKVKREGPKYLVRVDVDTNNIVRGGLTLARLLRVVDEINVGDTVLAHDYAEGADFFATVEAVEGKRAYLKLDWDTAKPW